MRQGLLAALILCLAPGSPAAALVADTRATDLLDQAEQLQRADPASTIRAAEEALAGIDERVSPRQALRAHALLCDAYSENDHERASRHFEAGARLSAAAPYRAWRATFVACRGAIAEARGDVEAAATDYDEAIAIAEREQHEAFLADALFSRGHLRTLISRDAEALIDFERALSLYKGLGKDEHARTVTNSIASLFNRTGDYARAREYYLLSVYHLSQLDMPRDLGVTLHNLGRTLENLGDLDGAENAYRRSLTAQQQAGYRRGIAYARRGLASVLNTRGNPRAALQEVREGREAAAAAEDARLSAMLALQQGSALVQLARYGEAEAELSDAVAAFSSLKSLPELRDAYEQQARLLAATGRWPEALERQRALKEVSDRILSQQREQLMDIQRRQFTAALDLQQIADLKNEKARSEEELAQQNQLSRLQWLLLAAFLVAILAIGLALVLQRDRLRRAAAAEARIRQSEERYRLVVEHVGEGMVVVQDQRIVYANPKALAITGYTMEELGAESFVAYVHADDRQRVRDYYERRLRGEQLPAAYEIRFHKKSGELCWLAIGVTVVPWDGRPGTLIFLADVTRRRMLEEELRRTLEERETILDNAIVGMALVQPNLRIDWANTRLAEMLGRSIGQVEGQALDAFFADAGVAEAFLASAKASFAADGLHEDEVALCRADGSSFWAQLSGSPLDPANPEGGAVWALLDVTDRHAAEEETRDALERQRELNELKSRFVSLTSHEFRTPLATILSAAQLLRNYLERLPAADREEVFDSIEGAVKRMTQMLDNVLLLGRIDSRMLRYEPRPAEVRMLCETIAQEVSRAQPPGAGRLELRLDLPERLLLLDERLLRHILQNLLGNAFKYSPEGGVVSLEAHQTGDELHLAVADRGIGIPSVEIPHLFEAFHRASNVGNIPGTGLGLSIVRQAVGLHGGRIDVDSEPGVGTTFRVSLHAPPVGSDGSRAQTG